MIYLAAFVILIGLFLLLHLRFKFFYTPEAKFLFFGLGRSGLTIDLLQREKIITLSGIKLSEKPLTARVAVEKQEQPKPKKRKSSRFKISFGQIKAILPKIFKPLKNFSIGLIKSVKIEELRGKISPGFDSPALTGWTYGWYNLICGIAPKVNKHFVYHPIWENRYFEGEFKTSLSIPLYKIVGRSFLMIWQLPIIEIWKIIKQNRGRSQNGGK